ncbi:MAG: FHA domain-containing protein [Fuerstiella sp.]|nr:FHA domain-containing protein [Fuerstiella sp.]
MLRRSGFGHQLTRLVSAVGFRLTASNMPVNLQMSFVVTVPTLVLKCNAFPAGEFALTPQRLPVILGRSHSADITIPDGRISRHHAKIRVNSVGQFELVDLDSTNLTIVNALDVNCYVLRHGDQILLGDTEFLVEMRVSRSDLLDQTTKDLPLMD